MMNRLIIWWRKRSPREQVALGIMIGLFAVIILWMGILRPLDNAVIAARAENDAAITRLERALADAQALESRGAAAVDTAQVIVNRLTTEAGFVPTRLDPGADGRVLLGLASAKPVALSNWLRALEAQGVFVEQLSVRPNSDATLTVDATLRARAK